MGRSALEFLSKVTPHEILSHKILLIGSKKSNLMVNGSKFDIEEPKYALSQIRDAAIFFNAAFLRREHLQVMSKDDYINKNCEISDFAKRALREKGLQSFINLSSGAARSLDLHNTSETIDLYSLLKRSLEDEYSEYCRETGAAFVNCRIFSLTGKHLNEFKNLALSSFIKQAQAQKQIHVMSPSTKRTYIDSIDLAGVLLRMAIQSQNINLDSGGTLITFLDLAKAIADVLGRSEIEITVGDDNSRDYFGDYKKFNCYVSDMSLALKGVEDQILETLEAFERSSHP